MEPTDGTAARSIPDRRFPEECGLESLQFREEIQRLITAPPESGSSFTALLELPATQAMQLLNSSNSDEVSKRGIIFNGEHKLYFHPFSQNLTAPPCSSLEQHAAKFSGLVRRSMPSNSNANLEKVKSEPIAENDLTPNSLQPSIVDPLMENANQKPAKRKEREKKGKGGSAKKSKTEHSDDSEKLPYVHVRARRGQATDSHSLAERARREKINARMKLLQELVPGCNKISGTALVLDEIINHVQSLQRQVEFLSMTLAAIHPSIDFNLDNIFPAESESLLSSNNFNNVVTPVMWPNTPPSGNRQHHHHQWHHDSVLHRSWQRLDDANHNLVAPENSLLTYDSSPLSASLHSSQLKMEL